MPAPRDDGDPNPGGEPIEFDGRYALIRKLGKGGMGEVWLAYDTCEMRRVALKRILPEGQHDERLRERFRREYRALGALRHPGVPTLYTSGEAADGGPYFTMELIRGDTLRELLDAAPLEPAFALALAIDLGKILMAVHAVGLVHRDVKPSNVIVEAGGRVRLIDFGACLPLREFYRREDVAGATATADRWGTGEHDAIGTPAYTDPAALHDRNTTTRSDIYSVCTILYEALTGRPRVDRESWAARAIQTGEFPPRLARLAAELRRGTEREPGRRHRSMAELVQALEVFRAGILRDRMQVKAPRRRVVRLVLSSSVLAMLSGAVLYQAVRAADEQESPRARGDEPVAAASPASPAAEPARTSAPPILAVIDDGVAAAPSDAVGLVDAPSAPKGEQREPKAAPAPSAGRRGSTHRLFSPETTALRKAQAALRACRSADTPLTVALSIRDGHASARTIDDVLPDERKPIHRCVMATLARLEVPEVGAPVFRTVEP